MIYLYKITNRKTHEYYIGISDNPFKRWGEHAKADSEVGNALRLKNLKDFTWEIIDGYVDRVDAKKAEKNWIEGKFPTLLNRAHNPLPIDANTARLENNEHFEIVGEDTDNFIFKKKPTNEQRTISKSKILKNQLPPLAPLYWWREFLGLRAGANITDAHLLAIQDVMTQVSYKIQQQTAAQQTSSGQYHILNYILSQYIPIDTGQQFTIAECLQSGFFIDGRFIEYDKIKRAAINDGDETPKRKPYATSARRHGITMKSDEKMWFAPKHPQLAELLSTSKYKGVNLEAYLTSLRGAKIPYVPSGERARARFGGSLFAVVELPRDTYEAAGFYTPDREVATQTASDNHDDDPEPNVTDPKYDGGDGHDKWYKDWSAWDERQKNTKKKTNGTLK